MRVCPPIRMRARERRRSRQGPSGRRTLRAESRSSAPALFSFPLHRWRVGVLALDPVPRTAGAGRRVAPLRYDAFETELARVTKDERAIFLIEMLIELQSRRGPRQHFGQGSLAHGERIAP